MGCGYSNPVEGSQHAFIASHADATDDALATVLPNSGSFVTTVVHRPTTGTEHAKVENESRRPGETLCDPRVCDGSVHESYDTFKPQCEDMPFRAASIFDCVGNKSQFGSLVCASRSLTLGRDNDEMSLQADLLHALGQSGSGDAMNDGALASLFPVMLGCQDKEGSLSQCGVLFDGCQTNVGVAQDPLNSGSLHVMCGSAFGRTVSCSINQSLASGFQFHRSAAPDSFSSAAEQRKDSHGAHLRLCAFGGF